MVANEAATETGFPPNVEACGSGLPVHDFGARDRRPEGKPLAIPFARVMMSGCASKCSAANILSGTTHSGLHFVENEQIL